MLDRIRNVFRGTRTTADGREWQVEKEGNKFTAYQSTEITGASVTPAVVACVNLLSGIFARLPIVVADVRDPIAWKPQPDHPISILLRNPSQHYDRYAFFERLFRGLFRTGNAYAVIDGNGTNGITGLVCATGIRRAVSVSDTRRNNRNTRYDFIYDLNLGPLSDAGNLEFNDLRVLNIHGAGLDINGIAAPSPILAAGKQAIDQYLTGSKWNLAQLNSGIASPIAFKAPIAAQQGGGNNAVDLYKQLKQEILEDFSGAENAGKPAVLRPGWDVVDLSPLELKTIQLLQWSTEEICRIWGVPPRYVGYYHQGIRADTTVEQSMTDFVFSKLEAEAARIESAMTRKLLTDEDRTRGLAIKVDIGQIAMGTLSDRAKVASSLVKSGVATLNEGRRIVRLANRADGDTLIMPLGTSGPVGGGGDDGSDPAEPE